MEITKIRRQKKKEDRYSVFVDGEYSFSVSGETLLKRSLKEGMALTEEDIGALHSEEEKQHVMDAAWMLLSCRGRSRKELKERLVKKEFSPHLVEQALVRLEELGYIGDEAFAKSRAETLTQQGKGPELIKAELRKKGIAPETINAVLSAHKRSPEEETERVKTLIERKLRQMHGLPAPVIARRLTGFLARRGFSLDVINHVLRGVKKDLERSNDE